MGYSLNRSVVFFLSLFFSVTACATQPSHWGNGGDEPYRYQQHQNPVSIEIIDDSGRSFNKHQQRNQYRSHRAYLEAKKGKRYQLRVRNQTSKRIAVVIAVDGRNILSGKKSHLKNSEKMYVLGPYQTATYKGWRTSQNKINRFYFTSAGDSYSAAWGDYSAMGVIAAAVYEEKPVYRPPHTYYKRDRAAKMESSRAAKEAGTGFGREEHSASRQVSFRPKASVSAKYFYKYEWRESLCKRGVISCYQDDYRQPENRFWPNGGHEGYAPYPPRYYKR